MEELEEIRRRLDESSARARAKMDRLRRLLEATATGTDPGVPVPPDNPGRTRVPGGSGR